MKNLMMTLGLGGALMLSACGSEDPADAAADAAEQTAEINEEISEEAAESDFADVIEARQEGYKAIGASFKTIRDELGEGDPDITEIQAATARLTELSSAVGNWFPEGSGPSSGVETEALPAIWEQPAEFEAAITQLQTAVADIDGAAQSGDVAAVGGAVRGLGAACKNCHDSFRLDD
tara:strand:+ start:8378 stop:8911 length:534 start_codon:yes stop_codon:yes gene_type:complete